MKGSDLIFMSKMKRYVLGIAVGFGLVLVVVGQRVSLSVKRNQNTQRLREIVLKTDKADEVQIRALLKEGANPNASIDPSPIPFIVKLREAFHWGQPPNHFMTIFMYAANHSNERILRILLDAGGDVHDRDADGKTAFAYAIGIRQPNAELLIKAGSDVNNSGVNMLPLILATKHPIDIRFFSLLLAHGADPNATDTHDLKGVTPLMWDAYSECPSCVSALLQAGANINACDPDGRTALMWAAKDGSPQSLTVLLKEGADPTLRDKKGQPAEAAATRMGQREAVRLIRLYGSSHSPR